MPDETLKPSHRVLRRLMPASRTILPAINAATPKRRELVAAACEACRKRKVKCDGIRPLCSSCARSKRLCEYTTRPSETRLSALKRRKTSAEQQLRDNQKSHWVHLQLIRALANPDVDAPTICQQLRQGCDPELIVQLIEQAGLVRRCIEPVYAAKQSSAGFAEDLVDQQGLIKLPPIGPRSGANRIRYDELFERIKSADKEKGVEILHRLYQGQDVSEMFPPEEDKNCRRLLGERGTLPLNRAGFRENNTLGIASLPSAPSSALLTPRPNLRQASPQGPVVRTNNA